MLTCYDVCVLTELTDYDVKSFPRHGFASSAPHIRCDSDILKSGGDQFLLPSFQLLACVTYASILRSRALDKTVGDAVDWELAGFSSAVFNCLQGSAVPALCA